MKQEIKKLWVKALRGGKYRQAVKQLRAGDSFCCLGVLCDVFAKQTGRGKWEGNIFKTRREHESQELPAAVQSWAGLRHNVNPANPQVRDAKSESSLAEFNDSGYSFKEIAAVIEKGL